MKANNKTKKISTNLKLEKILKTILRFFIITVPNVIKQILIYSIKEFKTLNKVEKITLAVAILLLMISIEISKEYGSVAAGMGAYAIFYMFEDFFNAIIGFISNITALISSIL